MLWNILGAAAIAALLLLLVWSLRGLMLTPVRPGNTTHVTVRLDVGGTDNQLAVAGEIQTAPCRATLKYTTSVWTRQPGP